MIGWKLHYSTHFLSFNEHALVYIHINKTLILDFNIQFNIKDQFFSFTNYCLLLSPFGLLVLGYH